MALAVRLHRHFVGGKGHRHGDLSVDQSHPDKEFDMSIIRTSIIAAAFAFAGAAQAQSTTTSPSDRESGVPGVEVDTGRNASGAVDVDVGRNAGSSASGVNETDRMDRAARDAADADRSETRAARADRN
jgi:hypothetical protein